MSEVKENKELENVNGGVGTSSTILCDCGTRFDVWDNQKTEKHGCVTDSYAQCPKCGKKYYL